MVACNPPACWDRTGNKVPFGSRPIQKVDPLRFRGVSTHTRHKPTVLLRGSTWTAIPYNGSWNIGSDQVSLFSMDSIMINTWIMHSDAPVHLQDSFLRSDWYSLDGCEIQAQFMRNLLVFIRYSTNIGGITNVKDGGERAAETAKSMY